MSGEYELLPHAHSRTLRTGERKVWLRLKSALGGFLVAVVLFTAYGAWEKRRRVSVAVKLPPVRLHFVNQDTRNDQLPIIDGSCPLDIIYTKDIKAADVAVYGTDNFNFDIDFAQIRREYPYQQHAIASLESGPQRSRLFGHHNWLAQVDFDITYRLDSAVPNNYAYSFFNFTRQPLPWEEKRHDRVMAAFISNCHPKNARTRVLQHLMRLLPGQIDSFGSCLNTADVESVTAELGLKPASEEDGQWNIKIHLIRKYLFVVAFENSNDIDYVTEKYFQAMEAGSVPVHMGAPNFNSTFLPAPNAAIDLAHYLPQEYLAPSNLDSSEPEELSNEAKLGLERLAKDLKFLASDKGRPRYEAMLDWKKSDRWTSSPFGKIVALQQTPYSQDCKIAGVARNQTWAQTNFTRPLDRHL